VKLIVTRNTNNALNPTTRTTEKKQQQHCEMYE